MNDYMQITVVGLYMFALNFIYLFRTCFVLRLNIIYSLLDLQVRVQLYKNRTVVKEITFDGRGSNITTWMSKERLLTSSWTDMTPTQPTIVFSIAG